VIDRRGDREHVADLDAAVDHHRAGRDLADQHEDRDVVHPGQRREALGDAEHPDAGDHRAAER